ncbi:chaperone protein dnaJ 20, chloroplastic-like [Tasmannia lanceolata]|uniref:chaperone protein dnaJ 20, chloroplastic-like n=1 Tax=Tasmannia lanceolata TaxID=3420 RepID=UPI0040645857
MGAGEGKNLYEILSLESENVGIDEIKKAYRRMALQYHPDVCPPSMKDEFTLMFVELRKAYETLSDPLLRRNYDRKLSSGDLSSYERMQKDERRSRFPKDLWENQLCELKRRSKVREKWRKNRYM